MMSLFHRGVIALFIFSISFNFLMAAEKDVDVIQGKIKTILPKKTISVFLLDKDSSILDITDIDEAGNFSVDASVLDEPIYEKVIPLHILIKDKNNREKKIRISNTIQDFSKNRIKIVDTIFP